MLLEGVEPSTSRVITPRALSLSYRSLVERNRTSLAEAKPYPARSVYAAFSSLLPKSGSRASNGLTILLS